MAFAFEIQPITASDEELRAILALADLPPLLPALAHTLGDLSLLDPDLRLDPALTLEEQGGWTAEQQERCRDLAFDALVRYRDAGCPATPPLSDADRHAIMCWLTGDELEGSFLAMLTEELAVEGSDPRATDWRVDDIAPDTAMRVAVIGAGMSGLLAAYRLRQAGVEVVVIEKNPDLGGTWFENTYPGCRVDVSNHVYCYSFMQKPDWPEFHSSQGVLLEYFNDCADEWGVRDAVRFSTEVTSCVWDDDASLWTLELVGPDGESTLDANVVVSAVGQLNRPAYPDIEGRDSFAGITWHSAQWDHDTSLAGKRVAVIGTGCSAMQFIPHVAEASEHLTVFQRTPNWLMPRPEYHSTLPDHLLWLFTHVPHYASWFRLRLFWRSHEGLLPRLAVDPAWEGDLEEAVSASSLELRQLLTMYLQAEFADRPDLLDKVVPNYPVGAKRFAVDNGIWARTLKRDDVVLETTAIACITPSGIRTVDGVEHEVDVIIYGTGFQASSFLTPMKVVGRSGVDLHDQWDGNARAYLGLTSPNFPNFFYMYGPNTNIVINGSIIYFSECEAHYIAQSVRFLLEHDLAAMDVRPEVHDAYNERIDAGNAVMAWGVSGVSSWYKSKSGRVAQNWPFSLLEYWDQTRDVDPADYETW
ncbi:MAG: flavin-containing monooxygenase [Acidimicrobiales bacterium]